MTSDMVIKAIPRQPDRRPIERDSCTADLTDVSSTV